MIDGVLELDATVVLDDRMSREEFRKHLLQRRLFTVAIGLRAGVTLVILVLVTVARFRYSNDDLLYWSALLTWALVAGVTLGWLRDLRQQVNQIPEVEWEIRWEFSAAGVVCAERHDCRRVAMSWSVVSDIVKDDRYLRLNWRNGTQSIIHASLLSEADYALLKRWHGAQASESA